MSTAYKGILNLLLTQGSEIGILVCTDDSEKQRDFLITLLAWGRPAGEPSKRCIPQLYK